MGNANRLDFGCGSHGRWYAVQTHQQAEHKALHQIVRQGFEAWLPLIATGPIAATINRPMFPGYLFVRFDVHRQQWKVIAHTFGVRRLFGASPERPTPIAVGIVEDLMALGRGPDAVYDTRIEPPSLEGRSVVLNAGPFQGLDGLCCKSGPERVEVLLTLLGRQITVKAARDDVEVMGAA